VGLLAHPELRTTGDPHGHDQLRPAAEHLSSLRLSPKEFAREMRVAACVQWYAQGLVSQERAAEIAGLSRADFLEELLRRRVPTCQVTLEELLEEMEQGSAILGSRGSGEPWPR
jgi:predicted HTH domain antitoxin